VPGARTAGSRRWASLALVAPAVAIAAFVVLGGVGMALVQSVGLLPLVGDARFTLDAYLANGEELLTGLGLSLAIATASTALSCVIGLTAAVVITQGRSTGRLVAGLSALTIPVPHLIGAASIGLLISDAGVLPRMLGIDGRDWPDLVGGAWWIAVVLEYTWKESAFVALVVAGVLASRVARYDETAALLGASRARRLRHVVIPLARPAVIVCAIIIFVYTFGSYEVAWLLGRPYPEPLPVLAFRLFDSITLTSRPEAAAVAVITTAVSLLVVAIGMACLRRTPLWR
jgi:putative spermidine/putrescine transport system permease protein